jgi:hypothetical protein
MFNAHSSKIRVAFNRDEDWVATGNARNEIWFTDNDLVLGGNTGRCIRSWNPLAFGIWNLMEADLVFDSRNAWTFFPAKRLHFNYGGGFDLLDTGALHELGHGMGLNHENRIYNIMGSDWDHVAVNGDMLVSNLGEDATAGLIRLYGAHPSARPDFGVSSWKYLFTDGEYSTHQRTVIYRADGGIAENFVEGSTPLARDPGQTVYLVSPGETIQHEFTYENNSSTPLRTEVSTFFSTNSTITTMDRRIDITSPLIIDLTPDGPDTRTFTVRIPTDAPGGTRRYIGVIIDPTDSVAEGIELNNATYIPIQIR